jgi:hypothetical protein
MTKQQWIVGVVAGGAVLAGAITFTTVRASGGSEDPDDGDEIDAPITGGDLPRATAAALAHVGGGRVTGTEVGDEESSYEVEITFDDGSQVDVQLDEHFAVVGQEGDGERPSDGD